MTGTIFSPNQQQIPVGDYLINVQTGNLHLDAAAARRALFWEQDIVYYYGGLQYNSDTAKPKPIIAASVQSHASEGVPNSITATLTWDGTAQTPVTFGMPSGASAGDTFYFAVQVDSAVSATGMYEYSIDITIDYPSVSDVTGTILGSTVVVVNGASPYGHGWALADQNYLIVDGTDGVILVRADGGYSYFTGSGPTYTSPSYDLGTLSKSGSVYTYGDPNNLSWVFESTASGKVLLDRVVDLNDLRVTYVYTGDKISYVLEPNKTAVSFTYDSGILSNIKRGYFDGSNNFQSVGTTTVTYDSGDLVNITDAKGNVRTFTYDANHKLLSDAYGTNLSTFTYASGAVSSITEGSLYTTSVVPQLVQGLGANAVRGQNVGGTVTNGSGQKTTYVLDSQGRLARTDLPGGSSSAQSLNEAGLPLTTTDGMGRVTTFTYVSGTRKIETITRPDGGKTTFTYNSNFNTPTSITEPSGRITTNVLDSAGNISATINPNNERTTYTWSAGRMQTSVDSANLTTTYLYNVYRLLETIITPVGARTTFQYDLANGSMSTQSASGDRTTVTFDKLGQQTSQTSSTGSNDSYTYRADGNIEAAIDQLGNRTTNIYNDAGRLIAVQSPLNKFTTTVYDGAGRVWATVDQFGNRTTNVYDSDGRQIATINYLGQRATSVFDAAGQVTESRDIYNNLTTFAYDTAGRQTGVTDPYGNRATTVYDAAGNVTSYTDEFGHTTTNTYSGGNLTSSIDWLNHRTTYTYTAANRLETVRDWLNNVTTYLYDSANRQTGVIDPFGNRTTTVYLSNGNIEAQIDAFGNRTTFHYDSQGRQESIEDRYGKFTTTIYDTIGRVEAQIDRFGNRTTFVYDGYGRQEATINYLNKRTTTVYDSLNRVSAQIDELGNRTTTLYDTDGRAYVTIDPLNQRTTIEFDTKGRQVAVVDPLGNRTTTVYDATTGLVVAQIDALGNRVTTTYDSAGRQIEAIDQLGKITTTVYDSRGRAYVTIDPLSHRATTVFDSHGRVEAVFNVLNNAATTIYDNDGRVSVQIDELSNRTTFLYDSAGRQYVTHYPDNTRVTLVFDTLGRQAATIDQLGNRTTTQFDSSGRVEATIDAFSHRATMYYDAFGRVNSSTDLFGNRTTTVFDTNGREWATIDALGNRTTNVFDAYGRVHAVIDALGNITTTVFDAYGRQQNLIDASNNKTTFVYDSMSRVQVEIDPNGDRTTYSYDALGRISAKQDRLGQTIEYRFDAVGRASGATWFDALPSTANLLTFTYDDNGNLLTAKDFNGTYTMTYDALGRALTVRDVWNNLLTFTYDAVGNRTKVEDSEGGVATSTYDSMRRLTRREFDDGTTELRVDQTYNGLGQLTNITRYADLAGTAVIATSDFTYDALYRLTNLHHKDDTPSTLLNITYTYDSAGRLASENDGTLLTFTYDSTHQVLADGATTVTYDATGNRTTVVNGSGTFTYDTITGNRLESDGVWDYTYDDEGNLIEKNKIGTDERWTFEFNPKNQLIEVKHYNTSNTLDMTAEYGYDVFGNRIQKIVDDDRVSPSSPDETRYAYDGWNPAKPTPRGTENFDIWATFDDEGSLTTRQIQGDGVDEHLAFITAGNPYVYLTDRLGSIRKVLDDTGAVVDAITYTGFGDIKTESSPENRGLYGHTGRENDPETGLGYYRARYLGFDALRWLSEDPIGFSAGDANLYRYVRNNPSNFVDPSGMQERGLSQWTAAEEAGYREYLARNSRRPPHEILSPEAWLEDRRGRQGSLLNPPIFPAPPPFLLNNLPSGPPILAPDPPIVMPSQNQVSSATGPPRNLQTQPSRIGIEERSQIGWTAEWQEDQDAFKQSMYYWGVGMSMLPGGQAFAIVPVTFGLIDGNYWTAGLTALTAGFSGWLRLARLPALGAMGCFVAGTPTWVQEPQLVSVIEQFESSRGNREVTDSLLTVVPIEDVRIGQRVPTRSPIDGKDNATTRHQDYCGWKLICMEVHHRNGSLVEVELFRSVDWIERNGLYVDEEIDLQFTDIEVDAVGHVTSIVEGPEVDPGAGAVVTGRFITRESSDLVRVTFAGGVQLVGTKNHPVWSPLERKWRGLGEFMPGEFVQSRRGLVAIEQIELLTDRTAVYNIEVDVQHSYEVTELGVLVHNNNPLCQELLQLRNIASQRALTVPEVQRLVQLEAQVGQVVNSSRAALEAEIRNISLSLRETTNPAERARLLDLFRAKSAELNTLADALLNPYRIASQGGRHAGLLRTYASKSTAEIRRAIASLEARAAEHAAKVADPAGHAADWATRTPQAQQGLINYWLREAQNYSEQAAVLRGLLGGGS